MKKTLIISLLILVVIFVVGTRFIYYGSLTRSCIYTEKVFPIPAGLENKTLIVAKDAYIALGNDPEDSCLDNLGKINRQIVSPKTINDISVGRKYFTRKGLEVEKLKKGTELKVVQVIASKQHGISTIDSGDLPIHFLILKDLEGNLHKMHYISLGTNEKDYFIALKDLSNIEKGVYQMLTSNSFDYDYYSNNSDENNIIYNRKLIEQSNSFL